MEIFEKYLEIGGLDERLGFKLVFLVLGLRKLYRGCYFLRFVGVWR